MPTRLGRSTTARRHAASAASAASAKRRAATDETTVRNVKAVNTAKIKVAAHLRAEGEQSVLPRRRDVNPRPGQQVAGNRVGMSSSVVGSRK